jgi:hypothetical protein
VYEALGFALPPSLQYLANTGSSGESVHPTEPDTTVGKLAIQRELEARHDQLIGQAAAFSDAWRLSAQKRRELGFGAMHRALVTGFTDAAGQPVLRAVPKAEAHQLIDILVGLYRLAGDSLPAEAVARLDDVVLGEQELRARASELQATARTAGVRIEMPAVTPVQATVELLRTDWAGYRQLILATWPGQRGRAVVGRLEMPLRGDQA